MLKGIIFDIDGVLIDTEGFQYQGWVEVLSPQGVSLDKEDYIKNYAGKTASFIEQELIEQFGLNLKTGELSQKKEELLMEWFKTKQLKLLPYAKEAIQFLREANLKVGASSGAPRPEILLKLKRVGLEGLFESIISRDDVKRGKPYPDVYLLGAEKLAIQPNEIITIEDTQYGVESAKSAGMVCLAIPQEFSAQQNFSQADRVFKDLKEAVDWIKKEHSL
ncbi:MAG: hypothetical protein COY66_05395 [Candidatus Kerfeldbacteria bacterium CG_4_10_14_0_8_um_filter_42_10]|uniref:HAD family phosphatase n=1 Tax=Candidatus Kerfeldbacteria bacterium CG_4_10_14_0_8_um_filter_42_10 TaxID=2014248 RepID=A0A2M7RH92_9BACT|nr:MAG: hypothetical protein COY66_05395 [Candidatus Kerfeldbacteria bacterium CG_4_10_14_0_8_um_filter_42_10]